MANFLLLSHIRTRLLLAVPVDTNKNNYVCSVVHSIVLKAQKMSSSCCVYIDETGVFIAV